MTPSASLACQRATSNVRVRAPGVAGTSSTRHGRMATGTLTRRPSLLDGLGATIVGGEPVGVMPRIGITPLSFDDGPADGIGGKSRGVGFGQDTLRVSRGSAALGTALVG